MWNLLLKHLILINQFFNLLIKYYFQNSRILKVLIYKDKVISFIYAVICSYFHINSYLNKKKPYDMKINLLIVNLTLN